MIGAKVSCAVGTLMLSGWIAAAETTLPDVLRNPHNPTAGPEFPLISGEAASLTLGNRTSLSQPRPLLADWGDEQGDATPPLTVASVGQDLDSDTSVLGLFSAEKPTDNWTLVLSDLDFGEHTAVAQWGPIVTAIPEPSTLTCLGLGVVVFAGAWFRRRTSQ